LLWRFGEEPRVSKLPMRMEDLPVLPVQSRNQFDGPEHEDLPLAQMWGIVRRHPILIGSASLLTTVAALVFVLVATPVYEGSTTLRIEDKQPDMPEFFRTMSGGGEVLTEVEVLQSRSLVEDAVKRLSLNVSITKPKGVNRQDLLGEFTAGEAAVPGTYILTRLADGLFSFTTPTGISPSSVAIGKVFEADGMSFVLRLAARRYREITLKVDDLDEAVISVRKAISVAQGNREARIVSVSYRNTDRQLVWRVPNIIADRYIARRQDAQKAAARSTVAFLRTQLDTLSRQLQMAEGLLRQFREKEQVVNPVVEGTSQVDRLIKTQSERSALEAERAALARLLAEVDKTARRSSTDPSPYRRLLAFPTLLRTQTASDLLRNLTEVEDRRAQLLVRRLPADPEVQALEARVHEIEGQLRSVATAYLQGLTNQVQSADTEIRGFGRQLSGVPRRELEFARLERQPKVLQEMYSLLQTRLKEAEIAQAVEDPSVQIVDRAVAPLNPVFPRKKITLAGGLLAGLLLGVALAFLRDYLDKAVHTRADVLDATGLPVLGLIPRIPRPGKRMALISERKDAASSNGSAPHGAGMNGTTENGAAANTTPSHGIPPRASRPSYTFLTVDTVDELAGEAPRPSAPAIVPLSLPSRTQRMVITNIGAAIAEAYGSLQTNLLFSRGDQAVRTVVFTSAQPGEGKTTSVVNLALSLTHRGVRVLLIDADLRRGTVHSVFSVPREPGLSDVTRGTIRFEDACHSVNVDEGGVLHFLSSGTLPPNPSAMLASHDMKLLLESLRGQYEMVIIDSPPVNMLTDAALLGSNADGVVLVARAGVTHSAALSYALEQLGHVRARILGVVLNDIDFKRDATYDAAYRYYDYGQYTAKSGG
jgi:capsular exopolysaccharide synthesis family protein